MSKEYYYEIICRLEKSITLNTNPNFDLSVPFEKELYSAINQTRLYLKTIIETDFEFTETDSKIIESLALRYHSFILPVMFALFVASFAASTFNSLINENYPALIAGLIFITLLVILSKFMSRSYNKEIFPFTLIGILSGAIISNIHLSIRKPTSSSGFIESFCNSSIELNSISFFIIIFILFILAVLNRKQRLMKFFNRMEHRRVFEIYKNYQDRIDEIASMNETEM